MRRPLATTVAVLVLITAIAIAVTPAIATGLAGDPAPAGAAAPVATVIAYEAPNPGAGLAHEGTSVSVGPVRAGTALRFAPLVGLAGIFAVGISLSMRAARRFAA
jgi:hypothetical protein